MPAAQDRAEQEICVPGSRRMPLKGQRSRFRFYGRHVQDFTRANTSVSTVYAAAYIRSRTRLLVLTICRGAEMDQISEDLFQYLQELFYYSKNKLVRLSVSYSTKMISIEHPTKLPEFQFHLNQSGSEKDASIYTQSYMC